MAAIGKRREIIEIDDDSSDDQHRLIRRHTRLPDDDSGRIRPRHNTASLGPQFGLGMVDATPDTLPDPLVDLDYEDNQQNNTPRRGSARRISPFSADTTEMMHNDLPDPLNNFGYDGDLIDPAFLNMEDFTQSPRWPEVKVDVPSGYERCLREVLEVFPDISHDHVQELYDAEMLISVQGQEHQTTTQNIITQILDMDGKYRKEKDRQKELKRKRLTDSDDEELAYLKNLQRGEVTFQYAQISKLILQEEFPNIPRKYIDLKFKETSQFLATYQILELANRSDNPSFERLKRTRSLTLPRSEDLSWLDAMTSGGYGVPELKREIMAARKLRRKEEAKHETKKEVSAAEASKEKEYREKGDIMECGTCCDDYPTYKFTYCDGDNTHFLCFGCFQRYADTEIGNQRYTLDCLDDSGCSATYSRKERQRALDAKTFDTLERLQQQAELKAANMKGLENCPFCDFAAICPPVKVDKEFRCRNTECERTSCRLCHKDSHIPMSCKEYKESQGVDERHAVEEAMTKALLKTCPKCGKQVLKQDGCNKVICTCGGMLCDYCGKDITRDGYNHFGSGGLGSKKCPTHDNFQERRKAEVQKAEAEAIKKAKHENPHLTEEQLKLKFSQEVENDHQRGFDPFPMQGVWPQMPNIEHLPHQVRQHLAHRFGLPMGNPPGGRNMAVFPAPGAPPRHPLRWDNIDGNHFQHHHQLPPLAYNPPNHPYLVHGVPFPPNAIANPAPAPIPDLHAAAGGFRQRRRAAPAVPGEPLPPPLPPRRPRRAGAVAGDQDAGQDRLDPGMLEAMHEGMRDYRRDHGLPDDDVDGARVEDRLEGVRRRLGERIRERMERREGGRSR